MGNSEKYRSISNSCFFIAISHRGSIFGPNEESPTKRCVAGRTLRNEVSIATCSRNVIANVQAVRDTYVNEISHAYRALMAGERGRTPKVAVDVAAFMSHAKNLLARIHATSPPSRSTSSPPFSRLSSLFLRSLFTRWRRSCACEEYCRWNIRVSTSSSAQCCETRQITKTV